jgi:signal transduction histidine kinase
VVGQSIEDMVAQNPNSELAFYLTNTAHLAPGGVRSTTIKPEGNTPIQVESHIFLVPGTDSQNAGKGIIGRDVTELRRAEAELFPSQKMQAVGQLTGGLAHDFNNLLTIISGNLQLVLQTMDDTPNKPPLEAAMRATRRASELTRRLLSFSAGSPVAPERVDINETVLGLNSLLRTTVGQSVSIETQLLENTWDVRVDKAQLENALLNMTFNARDAMPTGGSLTVATGNETI